jgi:hypothetical protein
VHGTFQNSAAAKCRVFWPLMQCERLPNDHLPEWGQQKPGSEYVLLIEGKAATFRLACDDQQHLEAFAGANVQRYVCCGKFDGDTVRRLANYGSATLYVWMEVNRRVGTSLTSHDRNHNCL